MDTQTVLNIIKMIDVRLESLKAEYDEGGSADDYFPAKAELEGLSNDLQSFIEAQVNYAENKTGE